MKKKLLLLLMTTTLLFSACGSQNSAKLNKSTESKHQTSSVSTENSLTESDTASLGTEMPSSTGNVTITIPAKLMQNETAATEINSLVPMLKTVGSDIKTVTNADSSLTITMSKKTNKAVMKLLSTSVVTQLNSIYTKDSTKYSTLKDIALNDSYDTYTVTTTATSKDALSNDEKSAALLIESTGFLVELFSGVPCTDLKVTVNYVNDSTKESIYSTSSDETPALKAFYS